MTVFVQGGNGGGGVLITTLDQRLVMRLAVKKHAEKAPHCGGNKKEENEGNDHP